MLKCAVMSLQGGAAVAHSVKEPRQSMTRGLAASTVSKQ